MFSERKVGGLKLRINRRTGGELRPPLQPSQFAIVAEIWIAEALDWMAHRGTERHQQAVVRHFVEVRRATHLEPEPTRPY